MGYQPPHYYVQIQKPATNGLAITAMILGIIAIVIGVWTFLPLIGIAAAVMSFIPALLAVIFGHIGLVTAKRIGGIGHGPALAGVLTGYATLAIIVFVTVIWASIIGAATSGNA